MTVLMPVWNAERFLRSALDSVLVQSFRSFELLVVDDGSDDATADILAAYDDARLRVVRNDTRNGVVAALNRGLELARAEYIARMDGDDVSHSERFAAQVDFLDREKGTALVGSWANVVDERGQLLSVARVPTGSRDIYESLLTANTFVHSSVMFRRSAVQSVGGYARVSASADAAQDYHLWLRLSDRYPLANIGDRLVDYRVHEGQVSLRRLAAQRRAADQARRVAAERRRRRGERVGRLSGLGVMGRLQAEPGSLGHDALYLCDLYRTADRRDLALRLAWRGLRSSPLCGRSWDRLGREVAWRVAGPAWIRKLRGWWAAIVGEHQ